MRFDGIRQFPQQLTALHGVSRGHTPPSNAARAARTALSISTLSPSATRASTSPVAGLYTSNVLPLAADTHCPSMSIFRGVLRKFSTGRSTGLVATDMRAPPGLRVPPSEGTQCLEYTPKNPGGYVRNRGRQWAMGGGAAAWIPCALGPAAAEKSAPARRGFFQHRRRPVLVVTHRRIAGGDEIATVKDLDHVPAPIGGVHRRRVPDLGAEDHRIAGLDQHRLRSDAVPGRFVVREAPPCGCRGSPASGRGRGSCRPGNNAPSICRSECVPRGQCKPIPATRPGSYPDAPWIAPHSAQVLSRV